MQLHVLSARIAKQLRRAGGIRDAPGLRHHRAGRAGWVLSVFEEGCQAAGEHLLEADDHDAVGSAVGNGLPRHVQAGGAGGAVVVDVVDGDARHAELVEDALAACGVAVAVAGNALVDGVVVDLGVEEGFDAGLAMEESVLAGQERYEEEEGGGVKAGVPQNLVPCSRLCREV